MSNQKVKTDWEAQKDGQWKLLTNSLSQNSALHSQLNNFIKTVYSQFRKKKNLGSDFKPTIEFKGFGGFQDFPLPTKIGHCNSQLTWQTLNGQKVVGSESNSLSVVLSQKLLLSKLGMDKLISDYQETSQGAQWSELPVGFEDLIGTISHELAHAYQFLVNEDEIKSQCESSGERDNQGELKHPQLAYEHTALTNEIQAMTIKLAEYQKFKSWWEGKEVEKNVLSEVKQDRSEVEKSKEASQKNESKSSEPSSPEVSDGKWLDWVLPVGIIGGVVLLGGFVYWIFKKKE